MKRYMILTYGCQMNEHDSEKISWILESMGYTLTWDKEDADLIVYNTCAIRKTAEQKVFGQLGSLKELKRRKPDLMLAVCGCMMQIEETRELILSKYRHVDIIFGTNNIHRLPQLIANYTQTQEKIVDIVEDKREIEENIDANRKYNYKAYVNIVFGCNNFCTYCIVPYTRGREKSREAEEILEEIKVLAKNGCKEITLLGQNVNSYATSSNKDYKFPQLLEDVNKIDGIERIRFMTSHPKDLSDELIQSFAKLEKLCHHLHLPIQSGSNRILKKMNRKYTKEDYLEIVRKAKAINPNITITTDFIIGFPGETEEDFQATIDLVKTVEFDSAFTFLYSIREGTPAANMEEQIDDKIKHERFQRLLDIIQPISLKKNKEMIGKTIKVLVEKTSKNNELVLAGRSSGLKLVLFPGDKSLIGSIVNIKIDQVSTFNLKGKLV